MKNINRLNDHELTEVVGGFDSLNRGGGASLLGRLQQVIIRLAVRFGLPLGGSFDSRR